MPGMGGYSRYRSSRSTSSSGGRKFTGQRVGLGGTPKPKTVAPTYSPPTQTAPTQTAPISSTQGGQGQEAYNYIKELQKSPGMTPEQTQLLRNRISDTHASQRQGSEERLRSQMQRSGLSGTGQETKGLLANEASNMSSLQGALTSQDLANMQMENQNKMTLAGLGVQASGNVDRNAFNYAQLGQQGGQFQQNFGWEQYLNELNQYHYNQQQGQWNNWLNQLM